MRIAAVSDDREPISAHLGRARYFVIVEVQEGEIISEEPREKPGHHTFHQKRQHGHDHSSGGDHTHGEGHGVGEGAQERHKLITEVIRDCGVVLARGTGRGAYLHLQQAGIQPMVMNIEGIHEAVRACLDATFIDHTERLH